MLQTSNTQSWFFFFFYILSFLSKSLIFHKKIKKNKKRIFQFHPLPLFTSHLAFAIIRSLSCKSCLEDQFYEIAIPDHDIWTPKPLLERNCVCGCFMCKFEFGHSACLDSSPRHLYKLITWWILFSYNNWNEML